MAVCVLAHSLKNRRQPFIKEMINFSLYISNGFLVAIALLKANAVVFKPPNSELFGYRKIA
ncbi:MAG: hypothetical protein ACLTS8_07415 [Ruminococcus sp.]|uniref:hypothetical protein n=1 Tax=Ruminococcus sp. TaxID=41978 RepID=UPI002671C92B|nr:hypothetical protein [uncultured Ruminococcus sp.]